MNKFIFSLICLFVSVSAAAETVYKTTNPDGSVEFTDQNLKDSKEIKIPKTSTFSAPPLPPSSPKKPISTNNYKVVIIEPSNDTVIIGNSNNFTVKVSVLVSPPLPSNLKFRYQIGDHFIDSRSSAVSLDNIVRGTHILHVSVINLENEVVSAGTSATFHMKRHFAKP